MFPGLETERLILREITSDDVQDIFACFSNEDVTRFYGQETLEHIDQAKAIVDFFAKSYIERRGIRWGMERKGAPGLIGTIGFNVTRVIEYGFDELGLTRIGAVVFIENEASNHLLTKLGFQREGILRDYMYQSGKAHDTHMYSILKNKE
ncbi:GNAT family protein [Paenibacillus lupini]|uniref:GNAT family N-acetyltransferase n=1 Tax=Paenibacillus lupini TaxID=1450204 RepID=UPI00141DEB23|nr:GNAT family protein [Paenibacillus lupini]NIK24736.1 ribosomal-protein-alanine N-acetyltransferase [Paenibacillus lupini]